LAYGGYRPAAKRAALGVVVASALLLPGFARAEVVPASQGVQASLLATAPDGSPRVGFVAADGSFSTSDLPPTRPLAYHAIYGDPANGGLPVAALVRTVLGS
jgi:hypothetical protein